MKLQRDLREFVGLLNSLAIDYVIVGGHAAAFHGHPRYTGDIDFFGFSDTGLTPEDLVKPGNVIQIGHPPHRIDLLTSVSGVGFDEVWAKRIKAELDGVPVSFPAWETLLKNKQAIGRDKDLADVNKLKAIASKRKPSG